MASIDSSWQELYRDLSLCRNWVSSTSKALAFEFTCRSKLKFNIHNCTYSTSQIQFSYYANCSYLFSFFSDDGTGSPAGMLGSMGGTWENKLPPSLTGSTTTSPTVSPHKRPLAESSPSKVLQCLL